MSQKFLRNGRWVPMEEMVKKNKKAKEKTEPKAPTKKAKGK